MSRSRLLHPACLGLLLASSMTLAARADEVSRFVDGALSPKPGARDAVAADVDVTQLPLLAAAWSKSPPADVDPDRLYRALTRWHFYAGEHFDPHRSGLWSMGAPGQSGTLASGAALELVELAALARFAAARGHVFDPVVWWTDHLELEGRLADHLYDPVLANYVDLDSLGRRKPASGLAGLVPVGLGARHGGQATRDAAWRLWTGSVERRDAGDLDAELGARAAAESFDPNGPAAGLHVVSTQAMATLSLRALDELDEPTLAIFARDALAARGLHAGSILEARLGDRVIPVDSSGFGVERFERSRAAIAFLTALGAFAPARADSLRQIVESADTDPAAVADALTDLLVESRGTDLREAGTQWQLRRGGDTDIDDDHRAAFEFEWADLKVWFGKALDLVTADVLAWHLRPDHASDWTAALDPAAVGRGDQPTLRLHCRDLGAAAELTSTQVTLMWTDGRQLLSPATFALRRTGERDFEADVPELPRRNGLWTLLVEGLPERLRMPAALSVVEPVDVSILPATRRGSTVDWVVRLRSQVRTPLRGRVDLDAPLSWTSAPSTSQRYALGPGETAELIFALTPDRDVVPAAYPVRWTVWDDQRMVGRFESVVDRTFAWLRIGPLQITDPERPIESHYSFDRQIDLAQRVEGVEGKVAWTKLLSDRIDGHGFLVLSPPGSPAGIHYAFTAFVTQSTDAVLEFESDGPARVTVNGREAIRLDRWGGRREGSATLSPGTNFVVVKAVDEGGAGARFRLRARDVDGSPLYALTNEIEHLVENYAYLARARRLERGIEDSHVLRLVPIRFEDPSAKRVSVVGSFNGWSPRSTPMTRLEDGTWEAKIRLRPGRFEYKFAVDGDEWIPDPSNPAAVDDGFGGRNSVLVVD